MSQNDEYDPEWRLWKPGRRSFMFMLGAAAVGATLPAIPPPYAEEVLRVVASSGWIIEPAVLRAGDIITISGVYAENGQALEHFVVRDGGGLTVMVKRP